MLDLHCSLLVCCRHPQVTPYIPNQRFPSGMMVCLSYAAFALLGTVQLTSSFVSPPRQRHPIVPASAKPSSSPSDELVSTNSYLSHLMLCVPDVNATIDFWVEEKGATLYTFRKSDTGESAFVGFGGKNAMDPDRFALEIVKSKAKDYELGNVLSYIGISMLLQYDFTSRKDVTKLIEENKPEPPLFKPPAPRASNNIETDPSGIEVRYVASAPGDPLARICFRCQTDLEETADFYQDLLGMEEVALDKDNLCLRFSEQSEEKRSLPTTLVFTKTKDDSELEMGNCFDHIVIGTEDLSLLEERVRSMSVDADEADKTIFMTPREMFGSKVMGLKDPNGYKIYAMENLRQ